MCSTSKISLSRINEEKKTSTPFRDKSFKLYQQVEFFERKLKSIQGQRIIMTSFTTENKLSVYSAYAASYQIAKQKKAHTIVEDL